MRQIEAVKFLLKRGYSFNEGVIVLYKTDATNKINGKHHPYCYSEDTKIGTEHKSFMLRNIM